MRRLLSLLAGLFILAAAYEAVALDSQKFKVPTDANYNKVENPEVYGLSVSSKSAAGTVTVNIKGSNTAVKTWSTKRGIFYDAFLTSGTANSYCVFWDSATPKAITSWDDPEIVLIGVGYRGPTATWESCIPGATATEAFSRGTPLPREFRNGLSSICLEDGVYFPVFRNADD